MDVFTDLSVWMGIRKVRNYYETGNNRQNQKVYRRQGVGAVPFSGHLAKSIVIEAAELLECFQWNDKEYDLQHVKEELADVMVYSQNLLDALGLDADEIINMKMTMNEAKYPVEKAKGSAKKYNEL